jgi:hypothetical protein
MRSNFEKDPGKQISAFEKRISRKGESALVSRRGFIRKAASGAAGASFALGGATRLLAGIKDSGEITLDGLMISYVDAPPTGENSLTPQKAYAMTLGLRSLANPDISLRARVSPNQEELLIVDQARSAKTRDAIVVLVRPDKNESFSIVALGGAPANAGFFGLCFPRLKFKGNGKKAEFRLVEAECLFVTTAGQLADIKDHFLSAETASSMLRQRVFDPAKLIEPRFSFVRTLGSGAHILTRRSQSDEPEDITSTVTARIIEQTGFTSDVLKQAFAVGSDLEITYYSAQDKSGKLLTARLNLENPSSEQQIYWDRVFKTFVIVDSSNWR